MQEVYGKAADFVKHEEHTCQYCGVKTTQPDSECCKSHRLQELGDENKALYLKDQRIRELRNQVELLQMEKSNLQQLLSLTEQARDFKDTIIEDLKKNSNR